MEKYRYKAINSKGRPIRGVISAANENDLFMQLQTAGLELVDCSALDRRRNFWQQDLGLGKVRIRDLIQLFIHMEQMQGAGVPLLDALGDIRDASDNGRLRDVMSEIHRDVSEGSSLSEALARHPKIFSNLYISLVASGEETGDLQESYKQLIKYLKWVDQMQGKIRKATRYPTILLTVVIITVVIMMSFVVPQIVGFLQNLDQKLPFYTRSLMATSRFFSDYWWIVLFAPPLLFAGVMTLRRMSDSFAYHLDHLLLNLPFTGRLIRKISIARFAQTFGALFSSGIDVMQALKAARRTVSNRFLGEALDSVQEYVSAGSPLSDAMAACGEFPTMVTRMVKVGEESGNLTPVLEQVSDFYTSDVDEEVQKVITMIEPSLTIIMGAMILWIAVGVFGPIYASFETIKF